MTRILAALTATVCLATPALAETAIGLTGDKTLVMIDTATAAVTGTVDVADVDRLLGIDYRPSNSTVVGVTAAHVIVVIDPATGATTELATMNTMLPSVDQPVVVDFNPMADRLRFLSGTVNHRVNPDTGEVTVDGTLAYAPDDMHAGQAPTIAAAAYINSFGKPEATGMYDIDAATSALVKQAPPNDGVLASVGMLGVTLDGPVAFDVATTADGTNTAWLVALGGLHTVDLETGAVIETRPLTGAPGDIRDMTVLPAM